MFTRAGIIVRSPRAVRLLTQTALRWQQSSHIHHLKKPDALRSFGTASEGNSTSDTDHSIVLYERNPQANLSTRFGLGVSYCHTIYWCWYALDFVPTVNASPITELHIHPLWGKTMVAVALAVNIAAAAYVSRTASKIVWIRDSHDPTPLHVYYHTLPFMFPSSQPTKYGVGEVSMNPVSQEVNDLKNALLANLEATTNTPQDIKWNVPLESDNAQFRKLPLAVYLTSINDIKDPKSFLDVLLFANAPQLKPKKKKEQSRAGTKSKKRSKR
ncbi:expressed unknown protein [Seminavis robusta]|uniref:Uncharacterized protein n=1 Tax=Seminavis robusta TaxID=568900 RepID=A0A9N8HJA4_9STRA|nr:expressed unknown protein [Seminavis robusta]|eukprot:Sro541_g163140.1 n/a (271) ;mRNA; f:14946-15758